MAAPKKNTVMLGLAIALFVAAALILLTTSMRNATLDLIAGIESVRIAQEAEVALLLFQRSGDPGTVRQSIARAQQYVTSPEEARVFTDATRTVERLVTLTRRDPQFAVEEKRAFDLLERLVAVNVAQAHEVEAQTLAWDRLADILGLASGGILLVLAVGGVWWLRSRAFTPVFALADAMEQFGRGNRDVRAVENGPAELREMTYRFNEMANALAAQQGAQAAFLAAVAHDLRTPLGVLLTQLQILAPEHPLPPEPMLRRTLEMLRRQVLRLDRMLQDLVTITGMNAGAFRLELADHDVVEIVRSVADLFQGYSTRHWVELVLPEEPLILRCDRLRIEQVVTNLLSNAIKYSPAGGCVTVTLEREASDVVLSVRDSGVGVSPEDQRRVFEPFSRLDNVGGIPGSGLGLYVVRQIVEAHGGSIEVDSAPGKGAIFRMRLPFGGKVVRRRLADRRQSAAVPRMTNAE